MKFSDRELEMISEIPKNQRDRKRSAWLGLSIAMAGFVGVEYFEYHRDSLGSLMGVLLGYSVAQVTSVYFRIRPEDKLIDLLKRYVNSDPEAIQQLSGKDS